MTLINGIPHTQTTTSGTTLTVSPHSMPLSGHTLSSPYRGSSIGYYTNITDTLIEEIRKDPQLKQRLIKALFAKE